jgi:AcrR family transcriptional regulator
LRVRTEARRRAILDAARSVFEEQGFDRATMAQISERLGGSKTTLYSYFPTKEELFVACVQEDIATDTDVMMDAVRSTPDLHKALERFGKLYIAKVTSPRPIANYRMVAGMPAESGIGGQFYEQGLRRGWLKLCAYFDELIAVGRLRRADPWVMAMHLKGMFEAEYIDLRLLNAGPEPDSATVARRASYAAEAFVRAYAVEMVSEALRTPA